MFSTLRSALLAFLSTLGSFSLNAQFNSDNYQPLQSQGAMPEDFYLSPDGKLAREIKWGIKSENGKKKNILDLHEDLLGLLHSGRVVYGDEISNYTRSIAQRLLSDDATLFARLRFYTLKENTAAAFSTRDGMIFVTTGLLSQLSNEAELAFLLAREIAHVKRAHGADIFKWKYQNTEFRVSDYELYGTEAEKEADKDAIDLLHKASYSKEGILSAFTVLIYSYIPFNDVPLDFNFVYADHIRFPASKTAIKPLPITSYDKLSAVTSPYFGLKSRSEWCDSQTEQYSDWGKSLFLVNEQTFKTLSKLSKYESISIDIYRHAYANALYSVYLLQKDDPNSYYLRKMKLLAFLGAWNYTHEGKKYLLQNSQPEGEIGVLTEFLKKKNEKELTILCLYSLRDFYQTPNNLPEKEFILGFASQKLNANSKLLGLYYADTKETIHKQQLQVKDSIAKATPVNPNASQSKYDKIKEKRNQQENANLTDLSDTTDYHFFNHRELLGDSLFINKIIALNKTDLKELGGIQTDTANCIVIRCDYHSTTQPEATVLQLQKNFREAFILALQQIRYQQNDLTIPLIKSEKSTLKFNEHAAIMAFLLQEKNLLSSSLPVNYTYLTEIAKKYRANKIVFAVQYGDERRYVECLVLDLITAEIISAEWEKFPYPPSKAQLVKATSRFLASSKKINPEATSSSTILENLK